MLSIFFEYNVLIDSEIKYYIQSIGDVYPGLQGEE